MYMYKYISEEKLLFSVHPQTMREPTTFYIAYEAPHMYMYKYISKKNMRKNCCLACTHRPRWRPGKERTAGSVYYIKHEPSHMYKYISKKKKRKTSCTGGHKQCGWWSWDRQHLVTTQYEPIYIDNFKKRVFSTLCGHIIQATTKLVKQS